jgi:small-conductance mechanosensitive channel
LIGVAAAEGSDDQLITAPASDEALEALLTRLAAELTEIQQATHPAGEAETSEPSTAEQARVAAAKELAEQLGFFVQRLKELKALRAQVQALGGESAAKAFSDELIRYRDQIEQVRAQSAAWRREVSEEELKLARQGLESERTNLAARSENREKRSQRLTEYAARKEELQKKLQQAHSALIDSAAGYPAALQAAGTEPEKDTVTYRHRIVRIAASLTAVELELSELENERDKKHAAQAGQRMPLLRELFTAGENYVAKLEKLRSRSEIEEARDNCDYFRMQNAPASEYQRENWCLRLRLLESLASLSQKRQELGFRDRFLPEEHNDLQEDIQASSEIWMQFVDSLDRRPSSQIKERYEQIGKELSTWSQKQQSLRQMYDATFDDRSTLGTLIDEAGDDIRAEYRRVVKLRPEVDLDEQAHLAGILSARKDEFGTLCHALQEELGQLSARLSEALQKVSAHLDDLTRIEAKLYWSYLAVTETPLWKFRWSAAVEEWRSPQELALRHRSWDELRDRPAQVRTEQWVIGAALLVATILFSQWTRMKWFRRAESLEAELTERLQNEEISYADLRDRLHVNGLSIAARTARYTWPAVVAWFFTQLTPLRAGICDAIVFFVIAVSLAEALIRAAFRPAKPRFRLVTCSNVVAKYWRRRLRVFVMISVVSLPIPLALHTLGWVPHLVSSLWAAYLTISLVGLLAFLFRKGLVLRVTGRRMDQSPGFVAQLISQGYPALILLVTGLIILLVLGYRALVTYFIEGAVATVGTILVARMLSKYIAELTVLVRQRALSSTELEAGRAPESETAPDLEPTAGAVRGASSPREVILKDEPEDLGSMVLPVELLGTGLRWTIGVGSLLLVLQYWGLSWRQMMSWLREPIIAAAADRPAVTLARVLSAAGVFIGSLLVSRAIQALLQIKIESAHTRLDRGGRIAVKKLLHYFILCLGVYFALAVMRIPLGAITVLLGTLGLGIGLGLQPVFMNFVSGLIMLLERHLKVGDMIEIDGVLGEVTNLSIRSTTIKTFDNVDMVIPNADFINSKVINWTLNDARIRGKINVGVAYGSDVRLVERVLLQVARDSPLVLADPAPVVRFMAFGQSSLDFTLYVWFNNVQERLDFITNGHFRILELFKEHNVDIPFPQRTLSTIGDKPIRVQVEQRSEWKSIEESESGSESFE